MPEKFYSSLGCGALGFRPGLDAAIGLAVDNGFGGVDPEIGYLTTASEADVAAVRGRLDTAGLRWGSAGVPVDLGAGAADFARQLGELESYAAAMKSAGVERAGTWIRPMSDHATYRRTFARYTERIGLVDEILGSAGLRFGLEYVGPKTMWSTERYPFLHTMTELRELLNAVGSDNAGIVLDSFHWYTAGESVDDLLDLSAAEVVAVDLNDAPKGLTPDEQIDQQRCLPGATGVIDLAGFVGALRVIGYAGPIKAEPFNAELRSMPVDEAVRRTATAVHAVLHNQ